MTGPASGPAATTWDGVSSRSLEQALLPPATDCTEDGVIVSRPPPRARSSRHLSLTLTARSVYRHPVARIFASALRDRLALPADLFDGVHTALQEVLMNAMLHGNLGLVSGLRDNLHTLGLIGGIVEARLASDPVARSMIDVRATWTRGTLRLDVRDSGGGFDRTALAPSGAMIASGRIGSGRGLTILEEICDRVCLLHGGTMIALSFRLPDAMPDT